MDDQLHQKPKSMASKEELRSPIIFQPGKKNKITAHSFESYNEGQTLLIVLQKMFSNAYIYKSPRLKKLMQNNPKGYVPIKELLHQKILIEYFYQVYEESSINILKYLRDNILTPYIYNLIETIKDQVVNHSLNLISKNYHIRRRSRVFYDRIAAGQTDYFFIEDIPASHNTEEKMKMIIAQLHQIGKIQQTYFSVCKKYSDTSFILVFTTQKERFVGVDLSKIFQCDQQSLKIIPSNMVSELTFYYFEERRQNLYKIQQMYQNNDEVPTLVTQPNTCSKYEQQHMTKMMINNPWTKREAFLQFLNWFNDAYSLYKQQMDRFQEFRKKDPIYQTKYKFKSYKHAFQCQILDRLKNQERIKQEREWMEQLQAQKRWMQIQKQKKGIDIQRDANEENDDDDANKQRDYNHNRQKDNNNNIQKQQRNKHNQ